MNVCLITNGNSLYFLFFLDFSLWRVSAQRAEEQLDCLAKWREGSLYYLMGRLQHQSATSDEDRYRCFVYERTPATSSGGSQAGGTSVRDPHRPTFLLAQSGDASCSGLTSPTEGSRTLKLSKGNDHPL